MSTKVTSKFTFFVVFIVVVSTINRFENLIGSDRLRSKIRALRFRSLPLKHGIMSSYAHNFELTSINSSYTERLRAVHPLSLSCHREVKLAKDKRLTALFKTNWAMHFREAIRYGVFNYFSGFSQLLFV